MNALWAIARLAEDLPLVDGSKTVRHLPWGPALKDDGSLVQLVIYLVAADENTVELLSIRESPY